MKKLELIRDKSKTMPDISGPSDYGFLKIWHCKYETLKPLQRFHNLQTLIIASYPDESLELLSSLNELRHLSILHMPHVSDLNPLSRLEHLISLSLSTLPSWDASGKVTEVDSLLPVSQLRELKHLELFGVVSKSKTLKDLYRLAGLKSAKFSKYSSMEIRKFFQITVVENEHNPDIDK